MDFLASMAIVAVGALVALAGGTSARWSAGS